MFLTPSLYRLSTNDNYDDRNRYVSSSVTHGGPNFVFSEATSSFIDNNRKSILNKEYIFFYTSCGEFDLSNRRTTDLSIHFYSSISLAETDLDPEYHLVLSHGGPRYQPTVFSSSYTATSTDTLMFEPYFRNSTQAVAVYLVRASASYSLTVMEIAQ